MISYTPFLPSDKLISANSLRTGVLRLAYSSIIKMLFCLLAGFANPVCAADPVELLPPEQAFRLSASLTNADSVLLSWTISDCCFLYRNKFKWTSLTPGVMLGAPFFPPSQTRQDALFGNVEIFRKRLVLEIPIQRQKPEARQLILDLTFQGCSEDGICYMPSHETLVFDLPRISGNKLATMTWSDKAEPFISEQNSIATSLKNRSAWFVVSSFLGFGVLLAFTPCIFPMLPILSGIVVGQGTKINTNRAFLLSLSYVMTSALTYTVFGILAGLFGSNLQALFQEPWIISALSVLFILLALSMFGVFQLQIPSALQTRIIGLGSKQQGGNLIGAAVMGVLSALAIGPCVTAPLTGALIYIGQTGDAILGGLALFALGIGMGIPLLVMGTYAGKLLPKAGAWLNITKVIFGMGLFAVAVWLLSRIMPPMVTVFLSLLLGILPIMLLLFNKRWTGAVALTAVYGILLWIGVSTNQPDVLRPLLCTAAIACKEQLSLTLKFKKIENSLDLQHYLAKAQASEQWVMLDFYADWCASCQELALYTFADSKIRAALSQTVLLQADVTKNSPDDQALLRQFNLIGPPAILYFGPDQQERSAYRIVGFIKADRFLTIINQVFDKPKT
ncbi:MAG: protein-disulfide reductase DsbD [Methylococcaceae bacterium]|nr:protein-disulfide reductase DsbD [Methylococcaceae bacterium]